MCANFTIEAHVQKVLTQTVMFIYNTWYNDVYNVLVRWWINTEHQKQFFHLLNFRSSCSCYWWYMPCDESPSQNFICKYLHIPPFPQAGSGSVSQLYGVGGGVNPSATPIVHVPTSLTHCSAVGCSDCHGASEGHPCLSCDLEPHHQGVSFICCVPAAVKGYCDWLFCR